MITDRLARRAALLASAAILTATPTFAADFTVTTGTTDSASKTVTGADHGVVQAGGTLTASGSQTINLSNANDTGVVIDNDGTIQNTGAGNRAIDSSNSNGVERTITINNNAGGLIQASDDAVRLRGAASGGTVVLNNSGTIRSQLSGQGIDFDGLTGATVTINNNAGGLIQGADQDGVRPGNGATVNNSGVIQATIATVYGSYDGVDFQAGGGTVNNSATGVIIGVRHGVTGGAPPAGGTPATSLNVSNFGQITGANGSGVGSDGDGTVVNHGTITGAMSGLSPNGDGDGVDIDYVANVENFGTIQGTGAIGVDSGGHPNGSEGIAAGGGLIINHTDALISGANTGILVDDGALGPALGQTTTTINNDGTIQGLAGNAVTIVGPYGAVISNTSNGVISGSLTGIQLINTQAGAVQGSAQITNDGVIKGLDAGNDAILLQGPFAATITNSATGVITGAGAGIVVTNTSGVAGGLTLTNAGTIQGLNGNGVTLTGPSNDTITNSGVISASAGNKAIDFGDGDDTLNLATGSAITGLVDGGAGNDTINLSGTGTQGPTANFETLNLVGGANWSLTGTQSFNTVNIAATARLAGLTNAGTLNVNGTIAPGKGAGVFGVTAVSGNLTFASTGVYEAGVNATGGHDLITVGGVATLNGAQVTVLAQPGAYNNVSTYTLLTAGSVSGTFGGVTSNMAFLAPQLSYANNSVLLTLIRNNVQYADVAQTSNQRAVANAITGGGVASPLYQTLLSQSAGQARTSFDTLSGDIHAAVRGAVLEDSRHLREFALDRLSSGETGGWGQVYIGDANASAANGQAADSEGASGFATGYDGQFGGLTVGVQVGLSQDSVSLKDRPATADIQQGGGGIYAGRSFGLFSLKIGGDFDHQNVDSSRNVAASGLNQTLAGHYDLNTYEYYGEAAFHGDLGATRVEPFINAAREHLNSGKWAETGGSAAVADVARGVDATYVTMGVRLSSDSPWLGTSLTPRASFAVRHGDDIQAASAADLTFVSGGPAFTVDGPVRDRNAGLVDLGLEGKLPGKGHFSVSYSGVFASNYTDSTGRIALSWGF